jgi:hypothetical protein
MDNINVSPSDGFYKMYDSMNDKIYKNTNPLILLVLVIILFFYFMLFSNLGESVPSGNVNTTGISLIEIIMWGLVVFLVLINGMQYFFQIDVDTAIKNLFSGVPEVDIKVKPDSNLIATDLSNITLPTFPEVDMETDEVFHVSDNIYNYDDAQAVCKAFDADLATYSQIENAYKNGGEWCGYGWSKDQMALFPTQKKTWKNLQKIRGHKHDCGRPGINGGYIKNKNARFGVNCYGSKPKITSEEKDNLKNATPYPKTNEERQVDKLVDYYKQKLSQIIISPFNYKNWNRI